MTREINRRMGRIVRISKRKCQICLKALPVDRYFNHADCVQKRLDNYYDIHADYAVHSSSKGDSRGV